MSTALSEFVDRLVDLASGGTIADLSGPGSEVVTFILGGLVGLFTVARGVRRALDANRRATLAFLVALVVGALRAPVQRVHDTIGFTQESAVAFAVAAVVGAVAVLVLDWYAVDLDLDSV
jgi:putative membrane protein